MIPVPRVAVPSVESTRESGTAIGIDGLSKHFFRMDQGDVWRVIFKKSPLSGEFAALEDVTLEVPKGEFVGVLGRNGAGKSTMLRTVGGIYPPTLGTLTYSSRPFGLYEFGIGGHELMTGRQFVTRWLRLYNNTDIGLPEALQEVEEFCELGDYFERPIRSYSAGMRARLFFGAITSADADVLLIDEILSVGDEYFNAKCLRRLRQKLSKGASGILASHDWSAVLRMCSHAIILDGGRVTCSGPSTEVVRQYLQMNPPARMHARFGEGIPPRIYAVSGEHLALEVSAEIDVEGDLECGISIEQFRRGHGWEHLMLRDTAPIVRGPGKFSLAINVPRLPLRAGEYMLCLFLRVKHQDWIENADSRSWVSGDPIKLFVSGPLSGSGPQLNVKWSLGPAV